MTFRVWYRDGSARLVQADSKELAEGVGYSKACEDAQDIRSAYLCETPGGRKDELLREYNNRTRVRKVEQLS